MRYTLDESTPAQVLAHLQACDAAFSPPLSTRVDLQDYAAKLCARAHRTEAWKDGRLAGLIATYANSPDEGGFISNVSVLPELQGQGIAAKLLERSMTLAAQWQLTRLRLEVHDSNAQAIALYRRQGFHLESARGDSLYFTREIP